MGVDREIDAHLRRFLGGDRCAVGRGPVGLHRLADQTDVQIETDARDVSGLLCAEDVSGPAQLEVLERHRHSGAELIVLRDGRQAVVGRLGERFLGTVEQIGVSAFTTAADASTQLMQLRQAEILARSTIRVFALEMSSPVSMMVVHTSTSYSRFQNPDTVRSS